MMAGMDDLIKFMRRCAELDERSAVEAERWRGEAVAGLLQLFSENDHGGEDRHEDGIGTSRGGGRTGPEPQAPISWDNGRPGRS